MIHDAEALAAWQSLSVDELRELVAAAPMLREVPINESRRRSTRARRGSIEKNLTRCQVSALPLAPYGARQIFIERLPLAGNLLRGADCLMLMRERLAWYRWFFAAWGPESSFRPLIRTSRVTIIQYRRRLLAQSDLVASVKAVVDAMRTWMSARCDLSVSQEKSTTRKGVLVRIE